MNKVPPLVVRVPLPIKEFEPARINVPVPPLVRPMPPLMSKIAPLVDKLIVPPELPKLVEFVWLSR